MVAENYRTFVELCSLSVAIIMFAAFLYLRFVDSAKYGRYNTALKTNNSLQINGRLAWFLQELPALVLPLLFGSATLTTDSGLLLDSFVNVILLSCFVFHYFNRAVIYPLWISGGKPTPVYICVLAFLFCTINGFLQGFSLCFLYKYETSWLVDPRFSVGLLMFCSGLYINMDSDKILINLRKGSEGGYKIPIGGMFSYVSCANYFGECLEWMGFAIACWSIPATAFFFATLCNLVPRAISHHNWYLSKFPNYPKNRWAVFPFIC